MQFKNLRVNHIASPLGYRQAKPVFSYVAESTGKKQVSARIRVALDSEMKTILFDSGDTALSSLAAEAELALSPRTRYFWQVSAEADDGDCGESEIAWFETGKMDEPWEGKWITAPFVRHPMFRRGIRAKFSKPGFSNM